MLSFVVLCCDTPKLYCFIKTVLNSGKRAIVVIFWSIHSIYHIMNKTSCFSVSWTNPAPISNSHVMNIIHHQSLLINCQRQRMCQTPKKLSPPTKITATSARNLSLKFHVTSNCIKTVRRKLLLHSLSLNTPWTENDYLRSYETEAITNTIKRL